MLSFPLSLFILVSENQTDTEVEHGLHMDTTIG